MESAEGRVVFVLGAPGAGKGTMCKKLAKKYGFKHLSIGDLLRQVVASPDADETVVEYVRRGELLTTELLFPILKPHIDEGGVVILDGFPRCLDQAKAFEEQFQHPALALFFDCPRELAEARVVNRKQGRAGDNAEVFNKRYDEFQELNPPLLARYEEAGKLIKLDFADFVAKIHRIEHNMEFFIGYPRFARSGKDGNELKAKVSCFSIVDAGRAFDNQRLYIYSSLKASSKMHFTNPIVQTILCLSVTALPVAQAAIAISNQIREGGTHFNVARIEGLDHCTVDVAIAPKSGLGCTDPNTGYAQNPQRLRRVKDNSLYGKCAPVSKKEIDCKGSTHNVVKRYLYGYIARLVNNKRKHRAP
ncbi:P-loop containing nucleoside triphosphate hydrolase protein [Trichoderma barbatum]